MTLVDQTQNKIRNMILEKQYDENGYLPSEGEMSTLFSVSRATVREAVRALEVRGFVQRIHGKGICVLDTSQKVLAQSIIDMMDQKETNLKEILEVRHIIETAAVKLAVDRMTDKMQEKMERCVLFMEQSDKADEKYVKADLHFHLALVSATQNSVLACFTGAYTSMLYELVKTSLMEDEELESSNHFHRKIYEAIFEKKVDVAQKALERHLRQTERNLQAMQKYKEGSTV